MLLGGVTPILLLIEVFVHPHVRFYSFFWQIASVGCGLALWLYTFEYSHLGIAYIYVMQ